MKASRKRRKKSSRISGHREHQFEFHDERSLIRAVRAAACAAREVALSEEVEDESVESGQESEAGPSVSGSNSRTSSSANRNGSAAMFGFLLIFTKFSALGSDLMFLQSFFFFFSGGYYDKG